MAKVDDKVMELVEAELKKKPDATNDELFEKAKKMSPGIGKLTMRQFHARYPLQVKRRQALADPKRRRRRKRKKKAASRSGSTARNAGPEEAVRKVFLDFASDLTAAEERNALVRVLASVDDYVDRTLKAVK